MILISVISGNVTVSFDRIIQKGSIEIKSIGKNEIRTISLDKTNFKRIPIEQKGKYLIRVKTGNEEFQKKVSVS